jgi:metallo-beta-lactamase class B
MTPTFLVLPRRGLAVSAFAAALIAPAFGADAPPTATPPAAPAAPRIDWNVRAAPWGPLRGAPPGGQQKTPFKIFDNVYYVGLQTVSVFLITTSDGLVLLDAAYRETVDLILGNIRQLGFDPKNIRYILVSHAHGDHYAGAGGIVAVSGAKVVMSEADWTMTEQAQARGGKGGGGEPLKRGLAVKDGETLTVGDTTFKFYVTPGHTPGALTVEYLARDGTRWHRVLAPGGLGFNFGPAWTGPYLNSYERLKQLGRWDTVLPNHAYMAPRDLFEVEKELANRGNGPHPAVFGAAKVNAWLDGIVKAASEKLAYETKK